MTPRDSQKQFWFSLKLLLSVLLLLATAHYGALAFGEHYYDAKPDYSRLAHLDARIEVVKQERVLAGMAQEFYSPHRRQKPRPRSIRHPQISDYIPEEGKFIGVDLTKMELAVFKDGKQVEQFEVLSKGRPGSHWETPSGLYEINYKETDHFSSIGHVHMPYSMHFYGNFFIHGWPYYPDGTPVDEGYSGGCIRLSSKDAKELFDFVDVETPVFVYDKPGELPKHRLARIPLRASARTPDINARAFLIADLETGDVYAEKNSHYKLPIASVTKLMTAVVANETISFDKRIPIEYRDQHYVVGDLLYPLLLKSDNDVAHAIADFHGEEHFLSWMNAKARALGMRDTHYDDSSGISAYNESTVSDLFRLARYLYDKKKFILNISKEKKAKIESSEGRTWNVRSNNRFAGDAYFVGGKLGYTTAALKTSLSIFSVPMHERMRTIAVIVLGSQDWKRDSEQLIAWLEKSIAAPYPRGGLGLER